MLQKSVFFLSFIFLLSCSKEKQVSVPINPTPNPISQNEPKNPSTKTEVPKSVLLNVDITGALVNTQDMGGDQGEITFIRLNDYKVESTPVQSAGLYIQGSIPTFISPSTGSADTAPVENG